MYTILLSYPEKPGHIQLNSTNGTLLEKFDVIEPAVHASENESEVVLPFNAFSPAATVEVCMTLLNHGIVTAPKECHVWPKN